jgi:beta-lactamase class A
LTLLSTLFVDIFMVPKIIIIVSFITVSFTAYPQIDSLEFKFKELAGRVDGVIGIAMIDLSNGDSLFLNGSHKFPMQSVFKFPLALAVLNLVDQKRLSLDQKIYINKSDLSPDTYSPMADKYPEGNMDLTLREVLAYTVSHGDNNGCDILFRLIGGTKHVDTFIHRLGVDAISIVANEAEMHKDWNIQFENWCTPRAMLKLLQLFNDGKILTPESNELLTKLMVDTSTGGNRMKGLLPQGTGVAHRTGLGDRNHDGVIGAVNDVGIVTLPSGRKFALLVLIAMAKNETKELEKIIAEITLAAYDGRINR